MIISFKKKYNNFIINYNNHNYYECIKAGTEIINSGYKYEQLHIYIGNSYMMLQKYKMAIDHFRNAITLNCHSLEAYYNLSIAYFEQKEYENAEQALRNVININYKYIDGWNSLGHVLIKLNRTKEAKSAYFESLSIKQNFVAAYSIAGLLNNFSESESYYKLAIKLNSKFAACHFDLGNLYLNKGQWKLAIFSYRNALKYDDSLYIANYYMGVAYRNLGKKSEAINECLKAWDKNKKCYKSIKLIARLLIHEDNAASLKYFNSIPTCELNSYETFLFAHVLESSNKAKLAKLKFTDAYNTDKNNLKALWSKYLVLPAIYNTNDEIYYWRSEWEKGVKNLLKIIKSNYFKTNEEAINFLNYQTNFYLHYQGLNDKDLQIQYGKLIDYICSIYPLNSKNSATIAKNGKIKLAFVIPHSNLRHTIYKLFKGWIINFNKAKFDVHLIVPVSCNEIQQKEFLKIFQNIHFIGDKSSVEQIYYILDQKYDVIIYTDIGMVYKIQPLAGFRLADIQCTTWGHPITSGLPNIDYFLSSELMEDCNSNFHYTEKLIKLPNISIHYQCDSYVNCKLISAPIFLCNQSLFKILPLFDKIIAGIIKRINNAKIIFIEDNNSLITTDFNRRLKITLHKYDISMNDHCLFKPKCSEIDFLKLIDESKIVLDTPFWSGGNTSLETLSRGKPIITLPGKLMRSRHTYAMLKMLSLEELIAENEVDYINKAVNLFYDQKLYNDIINKISKRRSLLYQDLEPVRALEDFLIDKIH